MSYRAALPALFSFSSSSAAESEKPVTLLIFSLLVISFFVSFYFRFSSFYFLPKFSFFPFSRETVFVDYPDRPGPLDRHPERGHSLHLDRTLYETPAIFLAPRQFETGADGMVSVTAAAAPGTDTPGDSPVAADAEAEAFEVEAEAGVF